MKQTPWGKGRLPPPAAPRAAKDVPTALARPCRAEAERGWGGRAELRARSPSSPPLRCDLPVTPHQRPIAGPREETAADKLSGM